MFKRPIRKSPHHTRPNSTPRPFSHHRAALLATHTPTPTRSFLTTQSPPTPLTRSRQLNYPTPKPSTPLSPPPHSSHPPPPLHHISTRNIKFAKVTQGPPREFVVTSKKDLALQERHAKRRGTYRLPASVTQRLRIMKPFSPPKRLKPINYEEKRKQKEREMEELFVEHPGDLDENGERKMLDLPGLPLLHPPEALKHGDAIYLFQRERHWKEHLNSLSTFTTSQPLDLMYTHPIPLCNPSLDELHEQIAMIPRCNSVHSPSYIISQFLQWFNHFGGLVHPAVIPRPSDYLEHNYGSWGIYATDDIPAFTAVAVIPTPMLISSTFPLFSVRNGVPVDIIGTELYPVLHRAGAYGLHLRLFLELANYFDSPFRPYFDTLPKAFPLTPAFHEIDNGTPVGKSLSLEMRAHLEELELLNYRGFEIISSYINEKVPRDWYPQNVQYNWEVFQYIEGLIFTRGIDVEKDYLMSQTLEERNDMRRYDEDFHRDDDDGDDDGHGHGHGGTKNGKKKKKKTSHFLNDEDQFNPTHRTTKREEIERELKFPTSTLLLPFGDLINHSNAPNVDFFYGEYGLKEVQLHPDNSEEVRATNWSENALYFYTKRPIMKGEELTRSYHSTPQYDYFNYLPKIKPLISENAKDYLKRLIKPLPVLSPKLIPNYNTPLNHPSTSNQPRITLPIPPHDELRNEFRSILDSFPTSNPLTYTSMNKILKSSLFRNPYIQVGDFSPVSDNYPHHTLFWAHGITSMVPHLPYWTRAVIDPESEEPCMVDEHGYYFIKTPFFQNFDNLLKVLDSSNTFYKESLRNTNQYDILEHPQYINDINRVVQFHLEQKKHQHFPLSHLSFKQPPSIDARVPLMFNPNLDQLSDEVVELLSDLLDSVNKRAGRHDSRTQTIAQQFRQRFGSLHDHKEEFKKVHGGSDGDNNHNNNNNRDSTTTYGKSTTKSRSQKWSFRDLMSSLEKIPTNSNEADHNVDPKESLITKLYPFRFGPNYIAPELEAICYLLAGAATNIHIVNPGMYHNLLDSIRDVFDPDRLIREKQAKRKERMAIEKGHIEAEKLGYDPGPIPFDPNYDEDALAEPDGNISIQNKNHQVRQYFALGSVFDKKRGKLSRDNPRNLVNDPDYDPKNVLVGAKGDKFNQLHRPAYSILLGIMETLLSTQHPNLSVKRVAPPGTRIKLDKNDEIFRKENRLQLQNRNDRNDRNDRNEWDNFSLTPQDELEEKYKDLNYETFFTNGTTTRTLIDHTQPHKTRFGIGFPSNVERFHHDSMIQTFIKDDEFLRGHFEGKHVELPPLHPSNQSFRDMLDPNHPINNPNLTMEDLERFEREEIPKNPKNTKNSIKNNQDLDSDDSNDYSESIVELSSSDNETDPNTPITGPKQQFNVLKPIELSKSDQLFVHYNQYIASQTNESELPYIIHQGHEESPFKLTQGQTEIVNEISTKSMKIYENIPNYSVQHIFNSIATVLQVNNRHWEISTIPDVKDDIQAIEPNNLSNQIKHHSHSRPISHIPSV
jgi:hypothetical protein